MSSKSGAAASSPAFNLSTRAGFGVQAASGRMCARAVPAGLPQSGSAALLPHRHDEEVELEGEHLTSADRWSCSRRGMPPLRRGRQRCHRCRHEELICTIFALERASSGHDLVARKFGRVACRFTFPWVFWGGGQCELGSWSAGYTTVVHSSTSAYGCLYSSAADALYSESVERQLRLGCNLHGFELPPT